MKQRKKLGYLLAGIAMFLCFIGVFSYQNTFLIANAQHEEAILDNIENNLTIDLPEEHILRHEEFHVTVSAKGTFHYTYTAQGLNVVSVSKTTANDIDVVLCGTTEQESAEFTLQATFQDNNVSTAKIFAVVKDCGVFLSQYSEDNALRNYVNYAVENELLTELEGDAYLSNYYDNHGVADMFPVEEI